MYHFRVIPFLREPNNAVPKITLCQQLNTVYFSISKGILDKLTKIFKVYSSSNIFTGTGDGHIVRLGRVSLDTHIINSIILIN